jgi:hypothetical protein
MSAVRKTLAVGGITVLVLVLLIALLAAGLVSGLSHLMAEWGGPAVIHIDGESFSFGEVGFSQALLVAGALVMALLVVMVVVPLALTVAAVAVGVGLIAALGAPVLAIGLVLLVLASPVLLVIGLVWLARRLLREQAPAPAAPTMQA